MSNDHLATLEENNFKKKEKWKLETKYEQR